MIKQLKRNFDRRGGLDACRKSLDRFGSRSTKLLANPSASGAEKPALDGGQPTE